MPTEAWIKERQLLTFWVLKEEAQAFRRACKAERKKQSDVLRETVRLLIADGHDA